MGILIGLFRDKIGCYNNVPRAIGKRRPNQESTFKCLPYGKFGENR